MYPIEFYYAIMMELERENQRKRNKLLRQAIAQDQPKNKLAGKIAHWFGTKMIAWGSKLQNINSASPTDIMVNTKLS